MSDKPRPAQDQSPFGRIERETPQRAAAELTIPRDLLDPAFDTSGDSSPVVPLDGLRDYVLASQTPLAARDRVWRWVVQRVRAEGGLWHAVTVYLAMPGLRARARKMTPIPPHSIHDVDDTHAALIQSMMNKVEKVGLDRAVVARLIGQAVYEVGKEHDDQRQVRPFTDEAIDKIRARTGRTGKYPPTPGSPDPVLLDLYQEYKEAPAGQSFDAKDAELIGRTYFETASNGGARPLVDVAPETALAESAARMRRDRAITRMARYLDAKDRKGRRLTAAADAITPSRAEDLTRCDLDYLKQRQQQADKAGQPDRAGQASGAGEAAAP